MSPKPSVSGPFIRGVDSSTGVLSQPKGSVPRASNLILTKRGSLITCDGSALIHAYNGVPTANRGIILGTFFFSPIGVPGYYMMLQQSKDYPLGSPQNLVTSDGGAGGILPTSVTLVYGVTASDGIGGETPISATATFVQGGTAHKVTLTWNIVPNAAYYNVYRVVQGSGSPVLVLGGALPVLQPAPGNLTVTYTDTGNAIALSVGIASSESNASGSIYTFVTSGPHGLSVGNPIVVSGVTPSGYNGSYNVLTVANSLVVTVVGTNGFLANVGAGGTLASGTADNVDDTQQVVLYKMPVLPPAGTLTAYTDANVVALLPVNPRASTSVGGVTATTPGAGGAAGTGGSGSGGSGGSTGSGGGGNGGRPSTL